MNEISRLLVERLQDTFLSEDLFEITCGFIGLKMTHPPQVMANAIGWALSDPVMQTTILNKYFEHLENKTSNK
jgi:hypothetical protein